MSTDPAPDFAAAADRAVRWLRAATAAAHVPQATRAARVLAEAEVLVAALKALAEEHRPEGRALVERVAMARQTLASTAALAADSEVRRRTRLVVAALDAAQAARPGAVARLVTAVAMLADAVHAVYPELPRWTADD